MQLQLCCVGGLRVELGHVIKKINRLLFALAALCNNMSLFKTREWWSATGDGEELHTTGSLLVAALGDDRYGKCIVVAAKKFNHT